METSLIQQHWKLDGSHVRRCCHAALLCRVLRKVHPLQSPPAASFPISPTQAVPVAVAVTSAYLSLVRRLTAHHRRHQVSKDRHSWVFHTTSLLKAAPARPHSHDGHSILPRQARRFHQLHRATRQPNVSPTQVGTHTTRSAATHKKGVPVPLQREPTLLLVQTHVLVVVHSRSPGL